MLAASTSNLFDFAIEQYGPLAWPLFRDCKSGRVAAVFESSFYVEIGGEYACIVGPNIGASPLNLSINVSRPVNWQAAGLRTNARVHSTIDGFVVAEKFNFRTAHARRWVLPKPAQSWDLTSLRAGLVGLRNAAKRRAPSSGFGRLIFQDEPRHREIKRSKARQLRDQLGSALVASLADPNQSSLSRLDCAYAFLGMGPGLTPSGDDFLGGLMIALHISGHEAVSDQLWQSILPVAANRTNTIALAHLKSASKGMGAEAVHQLLNVVLEGRVGDMPDLLQGIDQIGHTSGWDIVAGAVCAFEAISRAHGLARPQNSADYALLTASPSISTRKLGSARPATST